MNKNNLPTLAEMLAQYGRGGDTMLAHINPEEAALLKRLGGSGTINPKTGLPEFMFNSGIYWNMADGGFDGGFDNFGGDGLGSETNPIDGGGGYEPEPGPGPEPGPEPGPIEPGPGPEPGPRPEPGPIEPPYVPPPTEAPTEAPTQPWVPPPTEAPTEAPTQPWVPPPTEAPTEAPTSPPWSNIAPTEAPTPEPTMTGGPVVPTEAPTEEPSEIIITDVRPTPEPTEEITEIIITTDRPTYSIPLISVTEMPLPVIPTEPPPTESIPEIIITTDRPTPSPTEEISEIIITTDRPTVSIPLISVTDMPLPVIPTEPPTEAPTEEISEIIITTDRPTPSPTDRFSFTDTLLPVIPTEPPITETPTEEISEIIITTDRPTQSIIETEPPTLSISITETETWSNIPPTEPPTETPTETETWSNIPPTEPPTLPPTFPPTMPPTMPPTLPPTMPPTLPPTLPPQRGLGLNPGYMAPTDFYNTYDPSQSHFNWGTHGYQVGPEFNDVAYNQAAGADTPWGLQQLAKPLTGDQIRDLIAGKNVPTTQVQAATRRQAYNPESMITPNANNTYQLPTIPVAGAVAPTTNPVSTNPTTVAQQAEIVRQLGADWMTRQQRAAAMGDWTTYNQIQQTVNSIINPQIETF